MWEHTSGASGVRNRIAQDALQCNSRHRRVGERAAQRRAQRRLVSGRIIKEGNIQRRVPFLGVLRSGHTWRLRLPHIYQYLPTMRLQ